MQSTNVSVQSCIRTCTDEEIQQPTLTTVSTRAGSVHHTSMSTVSVSTSRSAGSSYVTSTGSSYVTSTGTMASSPSPEPTNSICSMDELLPLYRIVGAAAGGALILIIVLLLLIICCLGIRLKKAQRKLKGKRPRMSKHSPLGNGDGGATQQSTSSHDLTETSTGMYTTVNDEEAERMHLATRYADPPASQGLDASYAYVSHDVCRKKAVRVSCGDPRDIRKQLRPHEPVASTQTASNIEPQEYSDPIKRAAATEEGEYSLLQHNVTSSSKRHSAPLLNSVYDRLAGKVHGSRPPHNNIELPSSERKPQDPQPAHQPPGNPPTNHTPASQQQSALEHIYHVLESTQQDVAFDGLHPVPQNLGSEPANGASNRNYFEELYDSIREEKVPHAIYDTPVDISQNIYDDVK